MNYPDQTRNLNPTMESRIAMIIYGRAYSEQDGGSMDFWDELSSYNKKVCLMVTKLFADEIRACEPEKKHFIQRVLMSDGSHLELYDDIDKGFNQAISEYTDNLKKVGLL